MAWELVPRSASNQQTKTKSNMMTYTETVGLKLVRVKRGFDDANQLQTSAMLAAAATSHSLCGFAAAFSLPNS